MIPMNQHTILDLFRRQVEETPSRIALIFNNESLTYSELDTLSNQVAHLLITNGITKESPIAICLERSFEMIIGILAILKAGGAYVPIDPEYPEDRIAYVLTDIQANVVIVTNKTVGIIDHICKSNNQDVAMINLSMSDLYFNQEKTLPETTGHLSGNSLAYIIYTSGSTGKPKGVMIEHQSLTNYISWSITHYLQNQPSVFPLYTSIAFDLTVTSIFTPLTTGNQLVIYADDNNNLLVEKVFTDGIANVIKLTPSHLKLVAHSQSVKASIPSHPLKLIVGGEELETELSQGIHNLFTNGVEIFNEYGPTEATVGCMIYKFDPDEHGLPAVPIGVAMDHCEILLLDQHLKPVEQGNVGEIYISGDCLARGYYANKLLTDERFISHPFTAGKKMYKTGDNAVELPEKGLLYKGRSDDQVKLRGYRIELGEIDHQVARLEGIKDSITLVREDLPGLQRLVTYVVLADHSAEEWPLSKNWRTELKQRLPEYMIPDALAFLPKLPLTVNGKIDKKALPKPVVSRDMMGTGTIYQKPASIIEEQITSIWETLLGVDKIGVNDNFFEWGGNSLLAVQFAAVMKETLGDDLPIIALYQHPTIAKLAASLIPSTTRNSRSFKKSRQKNATKDIAIIGLNGRFPGADNIEELWNVLISGKETTTFFTTEELDVQIPDGLKHHPDYVKARGILESAELFDAGFFGITPVMAKLMDPQQRIFMEICYELLESTGHLPAHYPGLIGIYAGCGSNTYYVKNLLSNPQEIDKIGEFQVLIANDKDYIASRTAYHLDLKGPAVSVHSACSTSLLAVAQAVDSIRNGQCDVAIAGGISINVPIKSGHLYEEGAILSKDGHCRPFDANAQGTIFSDGAGVVLLKDLEQAKQDNDTIYAVIKGIGINNDGGDKGSFTAPSAEGQAGAIATAIADAGIDPAEIGYVEAHGTATPLGDPIEIAGLKLAFGPQQQTQFCRIGSVKGNVGHLTHAAGAAGLIKTALAMHHGVLPPSVNYNTPNPNIDFANSPFIVADKLTPWSELKTRYAGISSFGVGGTNVHVILEEYNTSVDQPGSEESGEPHEETYVINLSARNETSLQLYADNLAEFLRRNTQIPLQDIVYTLQQRRQDFEYRSTLVASDTNQLVEGLTLRPLEIFKVGEHGGAVTFMFPGQGSQFLNMGKELYLHENVYRQAVDECSTILLDVLGEDIRDVIFVETEDQPARNKLKNTKYTQPALFVTEYALAKLWLSWGLTPTAFIGHSIGEFVAAHLAGVFSLADALKLVTIRGRLIADLPAGSMLSIRDKANNIAKMLPAGISMAAINAPSLCVVAGETAAIQEFSDHLNTRQIANKPLETSHAFHSDMMIPALDKFRRVFEHIVLRTPQKPIASTVTGTWLKDEEATSIEYWVRHVQATVRFSDALLFLAKELNPVFLEVGPGSVAATLAKQHGSSIALHVVDGVKSADTLSKLYEAIGKLWTIGIPFDWSSVTRFHGKLAALPTYAFDRKRYWLSPKSASQEKKSDHIILQQNTITPPVMNRKESLIDKVRLLLEDASGIEISPDATLANFMELGLDSLLLTQVALSMKREFGVPVTFRGLNETYPTLDSLAEYLDKTLAPDAYQPTPPIPPTPAPAPIVNEMANTVTLPTQQPMIQGTNGVNAIALISQQIALLSQQVSLLQQQGVTHVNVMPSVTPAAQPTIIPEPIRQNPWNELTPEETKEIKKPFGATARIEKNGSGLTANQQAYLDSLIPAYVQKTNKSKQYTQENRQHMADPRVVSGFKPETKEIVYSIVVNKSKGCRLWDIDGNEYIDALNGFGSNFLGYQPEVVKKALIQQIEEGYEIGPQHEKSGTVCKLVCEFTGFERAALCNTGSEAVLGAMRIARTATGRSTIVAFTNSYHGIMDEVIVRGSRKLKTFPAAPGILPESVQNMLILDYGTDESLQIIKERAHELAAVLVEPIQSRRPEFIPVEFLRELREITANAGTALIFDEVISGFRFHPRGAQGLFDIQADIATYGKVAGAGISIGIIAGSKSYMDALDGGFWQYGDSSTPEAGVTYFAGTFVRHPLALATTQASLEYLKEQGPQLQEAINKRTKALVDKLNTICERYRTPLYIAHFGSLWKVKYHQEYPYSELLFTAMRLKGIHIQDGFPCFMTTAHTDEDINKISEVFEQSVEELVQAGFIPTAGPIMPAHNGNGSFDAATPPVPNARLGRDPKGNPAWYITDPNNPGKYLQLN